MTGEIKSYIDQKGFGYITGDDGKSYFFHRSDCEDQQYIADGARVEFDPTATPKGYKALKIIIHGDDYIDTYVTPNSIILSKSEIVNGWEIIEASSEYIVAASGSGDPDEVKNCLKSNLVQIGANAGLNLTYNKGKGSEGNYVFTVHVFSAVPVILAKRSVSSEARSISNFPIIEDEADLLYDKSISLLSNKRKIYFTFLLIICLPIAILAKFIPVSLLGSVPTFIVLAILTKPVRPYGWLIRR
jgi:cold shock CspA family protein